MIWDKQRFLCLIHFFIVHLKMLLHQRPLLKVSQEIREDLQERLTAQDSTLGWFNQDC